MSKLHETTAHTPPQPMYRLISSQTVPLTPELVAEQLSLPASPTERELSPRRVHFLRERFDLGLFHPPYWVQAVVGGRKMRANGMHSANMLSGLNGEFPVGLSVHLDVFECDDMEGLAVLFRQFDTRQSARTVSDVSGAYQGLQSELAEVPRDVARLGVQAYYWFMRHVEGYDNTPVGDDRFMLFNDPQVHPFLQWLGELFPDKVPAKLKKQPVFAALFATFMTERDVADDFWKEVVAGGREYGDDNYPTNALSEALNDAHRRDGIEVQAKGLYQGCLYAWNAVRDGKTAVPNIKWNVTARLHRAR